MIVLAILLQAAAQSPAPDRFSILVPVADERCVRREDRATDPDERPIVVCGDPLPSQALPYPQEVVPNHAVPSNPQLTGSAALAAQSTPCGAIEGGCQVGFGPPIAPIVAGAVGLVKDVLRRKPDKSGRVPIPLNDTTPLPLPPVPRAP